MTLDDKLRIIDISTGVDVGQGYVLAWSIGPDGDAWPVLADVRQDGEQLLPCRPNHFRALTPHEMTGQLPAEFQVVRCGAPTRSGKPCRNAVSRIGQRCMHHSAAAGSSPTGMASVDQPLPFPEQEEQQS